MFMDFDHGGSLFAHLNSEGRGCPYLDFRKQKEEIFLAHNWDSFIGSI